MLQEIIRSRDRAHYLRQTKSTSVSFAGKLSKHGMYRDTSMDAASRKLNDIERAKKLRDKRMEKIETEFAREANKVIKLQESIERRQSAMIMTALRKQNALFIQCVFRGYLARMRVYKLKCSVKIYNWILRKIEEKVLRQVARTNCRIVIKKSLDVVIQQHMALYTAAKIIQRSIRLLAAFRKRTKERIFRRVKNAVFEHVMLFGIRKAMLTLCPRLRLQRALYRLLQYYCRMRRLKRLRMADHVSIFDKIAAAEDKDLINFIKSRAVAMESTNSNILSVINTPRTKFVALRPKKAAGPPGRRHEIQYPKIAELRNNLAVWKPANQPFPPEFEGTYRIKRIEEAVTVIYDLVMIARNNLLHILKKDEYENYVDRGILKSISSSSLESECASTTSSNRGGVSNFGRQGFQRSRDHRISPESPRQNQPGSLSNTNVNKSSKNKRINDPILELENDDGEDSIRSLNSDDEDQSLSSDSVDNNSAKKVAIEKQVNPKSQAIVLAPPPGPRKSFIRAPNTGGRKLVEKNKKKKK